MQYCFTGLSEAYNDLEFRNIVHQQNTKEIMSVKESLYVIKYT